MNIRNSAKCMKCGHGRSKCSVYRIMNDEFVVRQALMIKER